MAKTKAFLKMQERAINGSWQGDHKKAAKKLTVSDGKENGGKLAEERGYKQNRKEKWKKQTKNL